MQTDCSYHQQGNTNQMLQHLIQQYNIAAYAYCVLI